MTYVHLRPSRMPFPIWQGFSVVVRFSQIDQNRTLTTSNSFCGVRSPAGYPIRIMMTTCVHTISRTTWWISNLDLDVHSGDKMSNQLAVCVALLLPLVITPVSVNLFLAFGFRISWFSGQPWSSLYNKVVCPMPVSLLIFEISIPFTFRVFRRLLQFLLLEIHRQLSGLYPLSLSIRSRSSPFCHVEPISSQKFSKLFNHRSHTVIPRPP